jgi:chromosomal replication initiator protein
MDIKKAQEIWEAALGELQVQVSKSNYRTWLSNTAGLDYQDNKFTINVPNAFVAEYLDKNQRSLIEKTLIGLTHQDIEVDFKVTGQYQSCPEGFSHSEAPLTKSDTSSRLNSKYTFASFVIGKCNRFAHAAALAVTESPGHSYNPLLIHGDAGLGKTHLLQAVGHAALTKNLQVLYVSAEQFTHEFIDAIRQRKASEFRNRFRNVDMLLIDDIQFISGKEQTEESFFHTFNDLHNENRQVVITSNLPPNSLGKLDARLKSRFEWGLVVSIQSPDFETRLAILQAKVEQKGLPFLAEVLEYIAHQAKQNIRELEGYLNRVIAFAKLTRMPPTLALASEALSDIGNKKPKPARNTPSMVIETVAKSFQLSPQDIKSRKRDKETALARQVAMYLLRESGNYSLAQIGKELGNRDHSTVLHACEKIARALKDNISLKNLSNDIKQNISKE